MYQYTNGRKCEPPLMMIYECVHVCSLLPSASADGMKGSKIYFVFKGDESHKGTGFAGQIIDRLLKHNAIKLSLI